MLTMKTNGQQLDITASADTTLPRLSYALQSAMAWFAGQGMHRVTMRRLRKHDGTCNIFMSSDLQPSRDMYSGVTRIGELARVGLLAKHIEDRHRWDIKDESATLVHPDELRPTLTLGDVAFGVADMVVFMLRRRVTEVRWQLAQSEMQLWGAPGLTAREVREMGKWEADYEPAETVGSLPG